MKHKIAIVDDHTLLSQAIGNLIESFDDFETDGIFHNGQELINALKNKTIQPQIVLMDVNMPVLNGIETTKILTKEFPDLLVLALSVDEDENTIIQMLKSGAKGYLSKDIQKDILYLALTHTLQHGFFHTQNVTHALLGSLKKKNELDDLKEREIEFIQLACSDLTYKEIADKMFLSPKTIDNYRDAVFSKLNIKNRVGLVLFAIKSGIYVVDQ
ncbi:response regulator transcription factor [Moheibacter lacus]|uniref:Response regulator transcription factor n=1 Tax=Moheibacter lacus TaxID=2745851 RepID=A0A838ZTZ1_9FLAO|nr:response regulator transcription factor [Moheibacter lacus]MBA5630447.1 response regulator transcription factor [Moheibacter lacus]